MIPVRESIYELYIKKSQLHRVATVNIKTFEKKKTAKLFPIDGFNSFKETSLDELDLKLSDEEVATKLISLLDDSAGVFTMIDAKSSSRIQINITLSR